MDWLKPANLMLALTLLCAGYVVWKAQQRDDFDWAEMLKDETGKPSAFRILSFGAFGVTAWGLMLYIISEKVTEWMWLYFLLAWSGAAVLAKAIDAWKGKQ